MKRPTSLAIVGWFLLVINAISLVSFLFTLRNPMTMQAFGQFAFPVWVTIGFGMLAQVVTIVAAVGILKGHAWARNTYLGVSVLGILLSFFNMPSVVMLIPGIVVFVIVAFFLLRPPATAYFHRQPVAAA